MSLCLSMYHDNKFFVWADSRLSAEVGGKNYAISDEYDKLRRIGSRVVFMSGISEIVEEVFNRIKPESSYEEIQREARAVYSDFVAAHKDSPGYADSKHGIEFGIYLHEIVDGAPVYVQLAYRDNFEIKKETPSNADVYGVAAHSDVALPLFVRKINSSTPVEFAARRTFEYVADEVVGGYLTMFIIQPEGVVSSRCVIRDRKPVRWLRDLSIPIHADMQGNAVLNKLTANSANILSSNIKDGSIVGSSINVGNGKFTVSSAGDVYTQGGVFVGGTITGALLRTAASGARVEVDAQGWRTYDSSGRQRISINSNDAQGMSAINFAGTNGGGGYVNGGDSVFSIITTNDMLIAALGGNLTIQGNVNFSGSVSGIGISSISGLQTRLNSIDSAISDRAYISNVVVNAAFDPSSRNLKFYNQYGTQLFAVNIPA